MEVGVPQVYVPVLVCRPHVGVSKFEQRNRWAPTPCICSFYTHSFIPFFLHGVRGGVFKSLFCFKKKFGK